MSALSRQFVRGLQANSYEVETWALADVDGLDLIDAASTAQAFRAGGRLHLVAHGFWSALRRSFDQVVVTHLHLLPAIAGYVARGTRVAVSLNGIECWVPLRGTRLALLARADSLTAISSYTAARFVAANASFADRMIHICPPCTPGDIESSELPPTPSVLVVGRLSRAERYKGHDALLNVWPSVLQVVPDARLVFVGDGDDRRRIEERILAEGLRGSVRSLGLVTRAALRMEYASCRVFALPSSGEGFGIVFLEAMAAGRPCIGGRGGADDVIEPGRTGMLIPPADEAALRRALLELLTDEALCRSMGQAGRARATRYFSAEAFALRLAHAFGLERARQPARC